MGTCLGFTGLEKFVSETDMQHVQLARSLASTGICIHANVWVRVYTHAHTHTHSYMKAVYKRTYPPWEQRASLLNLKTKGNPANGTHLYVIKMSLML